METMVTGPARSTRTVSASVMLRYLSFFSPRSSFRGDAKHRTRNLEIPRCAIAHLRSGPSDHPGMTESVSGHLREQLVDILPVHQMIDKRLQIIRAAIAIIDVIGMLPDVDAEDRRGAMHQRVF